jgi:hypothetical protein
MKRKSLLLAFAALALAGCNDSNFVDGTSATPTAPPQTPTPTPSPTPTPVSSVGELYHQTYADRKVDVLWVVDNSGSMSDKQMQLGNAFTDFVQGFIALNLDYQLGVVTTDLSNSSQSGKLQGSPTFLTPATPNIVSTFQSRVNVGTSGDATERGLGAAKAALSEPLRSGFNAGFLRDDAVLSVLFLSDEDDQSSGTWQDYAYFFGGLKADPSKLHVTAIVGDLGTGCSGAGTASAGDRYIYTVDALSGTVSSICASDFQVTLSDLGSIVAALAATFPLQFQPIPGTIQIKIDGQTVPSSAATWHYNPVSNEIAFAADAIPAECANVEIDYALAPGQNVTDPVYEHPEDPNCTP